MYMNNQRNYQTTNNHSQSYTQDYPATTIHCIILQSLLKTVTTMNIFWSCDYHVSNNYEYNYITAKTKTVTTMNIFLSCDYHVSNNYEYNYITAKTKTVTTMNIFLSWSCI